MNNIGDGSLSDIAIPWDFKEFNDEVKEEPYDADNLEEFLETQLNEQDQMDQVNFYFHFLKVRLIKVLFF